jgi:hypothetical protein
MVDYVMTAQMLPLINGGMVKRRNIFGKEKEKESRNEFS